MKPEQLIKQFEGGRFEPVYFFSGDETFLKEEAIKRLIAKVIDPGTEAFCLDVMHGDNSDAQGILTAASMVPMLADRRVVVIRDFQRLARQDQEAVVEYAEKPLSSTIMVVETPRVNLKTRLYARLNKASTSIVFYPLFPERVPAWLHQHVKQYGKRLTPEAAHQLQANVGTDLWELAGELKKLALFVADRDTIEEKDVEAALGPVRAGTMFEIADALGEKDLAKALSAYGRARDAGTEPQAIVALLVRHLTMLWKIRFMKRDRIQDEEIRKALQLNWGFNRIYNRYTAQARLLTARDLQNGFEALYAADLTLKTTGLSPDLVMKRLLYDLCTGQRTQVWNSLSLKMTQ